MYSLPENASAAAQVHDGGVADQIGVEGEGISVGLRAGLREGQAGGEGTF